MISVKRKIQIRSVAHGARTLAVAPEAPVGRRLRWRAGCPAWRGSVALAVRFERQIRARRRPRPVRAGEAVPGHAAPDDADHEPGPRLPRRSRSKSFPCRGFRMGATR
jgi:hypothetical protein